MSENNLVVVHGSYFVNNFGDTLLIKLLCEKIAKHVGAENVRLARVGHINEQESIGFPIVKDNEISQVKHVFYSGGGYFGEPNVGFFKRWRWAIRNYNRHFSWNKPFDKAKYHIIGVGVGPIKNLFYRSAVRNFLNNCDDVLVRDSESNEYCHEYFPEVKNIGLCVDLALGTPRLNCKKSKISIHLDTSDSSIIKSVLSYLKDKIDESKISFIFDNNVSFNENTLSKYNTILSELKYKSDDYEFIEYKDVSTLIETLSSSKIVITSKLHVGIITISQYGKVIAIPNHSKTQRLYSQLSISDFCIERSEYNVNKFDHVYRKLDNFQPDYKIRDKGISVIDEKIKDILTGSK